MEIYIFFKVITQFVPNSACVFGWLVDTICSKPFFEFLFFSIFIPILDFEKIAFIGISAPKCLCASDLSHDRYQKLHRGLLKC